MSEKCFSHPAIVAELPTSVIEQGVRIIRGVEDFKLDQLQSLVHQSIDNPVGPVNSADRPGLLAPIKVWHGVGVETKLLYHLLREGDDKILGLSWVYKKQYDAWTDPRSRPNVQVGIQMFENSDLTNFLLQTAMKDVVALERSSHSPVTANGFWTQVERPSLASKQFFKRNKFSQNGRKSATSTSDTFVLPIVHL